jgi:RHS repeat-associated protein
MWVVSYHLHSTSVLVNRDGTVKDRNYYYPYGGNRGGSAFSGITTRRFTGQYHEPGLPGGEGLSYYNARWYDSQITVFISADTLVPDPGNPQTLNRYAYVLHNPLRHTDPSGNLVCYDDQCHTPRSAQKTLQLTQKGIARTYHITWRGNWELRNVYRVLLGIKAIERAVERKIGKPAAPVMRKLLTNVRFERWPNQQRFESARGNTKISWPQHPIIWAAKLARPVEGPPSGVALPRSDGTDQQDTIYFFDGMGEKQRWVPVHEIAHILDYRVARESKVSPSQQMAQQVSYLDAPTSYGRTAVFPVLEDFADSWTAWVYGPGLVVPIINESGQLDPVREQFFNSLIVQFAGQ